MVIATIVRNNLNKGERISSENRKKWHLLVRSPAAMADEHEAFPNVSFGSRLCKNSDRVVISVLLKVYQDECSYHGWFSHSSYFISEQLDDQVSKDSATRVIDSFIDGIDLSDMGLKQLELTLVGLLITLKSC